MKMERRKDAKRVWQKKQRQLSADWPKYKAKKAKIDYESYASRDE